MRKVPVKLAKGERFIDARVWNAMTPQERSFIENLNNRGREIQRLKKGGKANYAQVGGQQSFSDWTTSRSNQIGQLGEFLTRSAYGDKEAYTSLRPKEQGKSAQQQISELIAAGYSEQEAKDKVYGMKSADSAQSNKQKALAESNKEVIELAKRAMELVAPASEAADYINGYVKMPGELEAQASAEEEVGKNNLLSTIGQTISAGVQTVAGGFEQTRRIREEARTRIVASSFPESYNAYVRIRGLANRMTLPIVASGALGVNPTDKDVELAKQATIDLTAPSNTWVSQLNQLISVSGGTPIEMVAQQTGNTETVAAVQAGQTQVNVPNNLDEGDMGPMTPSAPTSAEPSNPLLNMTDNLDEGDMGPMTPSTPEEVDIPIELIPLARSKFGQKKILKWAEKLPEGTIVIWGDTKGPVEELIKDIKEQLGG